MFPFAGKSKKITRKMEEWLEHPLEIGEKPDFMEIVHEGTILDPVAGKDVTAYLVYYKYVKKKTEGIGFVGPLTWSFTSCDLKGLKKNVILKLYQGWLISFYCQNFIEQKDITENELEIIKNELMRLDYTIVVGVEDIFKIKQTTNTNGDNWITIPVSKAGQDSQFSFMYLRESQSVQLIPDFSNEKVPEVLKHYEFIGTVLTVQRMFQSS